MIYVNLIKNNNPIIITLFFGLFLGYIFGYIFSYFSILANFYVLSSLFSLLTGCIYWYRILFFQYWNKLKFLYNLFKSLSNHDHQNKMSSSNNSDNSFILDTRFNIATIKYKKYGKEYDFHVPYDSKSPLTRLRNRKVYLKYQEIDREKDIVELNDEGVGVGFIENDVIKNLEITQQPGVPYCVTAKDYESENIKVISIQVKDRLGEVLNEYVGDEKVIITKKKIY